MFTLTDLEEGGNLYFNPSEKELSQLKEDLSSVKDFSKSSIWVNRKDGMPVKASIAKLEFEGKPFKIQLKKLLQLS